MRIALLGFGIEAQSAYNFLCKKYPNAFFDIYDQNIESKKQTPKDAEVFLGVNDFSHIEADLLVRTPAVNPHELPTNVNTTSVTEIFFKNCPAKIVGVTGSKGKGTTSSFLAEIFKSAGIKTHLVGNIGVPALDILPEIKKDDIVVYEMSSFQLWDLEVSPSVAVITNFEPDHLDVHDDFDDYIQAKMNIVRFQTSGDICVYNCENNEVSKQIQIIQKDNPADFMPFPDDEFAKFDNDYFYWQGAKTFKTSAVKLPGSHNLMNAIAAMNASYDILNKKIGDFEKIKNIWKDGLSSFHGLPHRLKFIAEKSKIRFYDDSIATTPGSAIAAIKAFSSPKILLMGGSDKGADLDELMDIIADSETNDLRNIILFGEESRKLQEELISRGFDRFINLGIDTDMNEIVNCAYDLASVGDIVILSPAHASFDMFNSYSERGDKFIEAVIGLGK